MDAILEGYPKSKKELFVSPYNIYVSILEEVRKIVPITSGKMGGCVYFHG